MADGRSYMSSNFNVVGDGSEGGKRQIATQNHLNQNAWQGCRVDVREHWGIQQDGFLGGENPYRHISSGSRLFNLLVSPITELFIGPVGSGQGNIEN